MLAPYEEPQEDCPYCGDPCDAQFVDIGVGMQQVSPYQCECGAVEAGPFDSRKDVDENTGWYAPEGYEPSEASQGLIPIPDGYNEN
jgi:hypothetical protein